ncbi:hypothetical protein SKAU_G00368540 [Synaphobranchus kaupii]|uniref:Uncharacterized protein n=1 Tax=Synaphobranchus kaupii TaxID=118154 RepID=A0A9Q1IDL3_SYNKA|nr:hypothetical protein SKAU_G00368540 [Synaphobranchus kaupii]
MPLHMVGAPSQDKDSQVDTPITLYPLGTAGGQLHCNYDSTRGRRFSETAGFNISGTGESSQGQAGEWAKIKHFTKLCFLLPHCLETPQLRNGPALQLVPQKTPAPTINIVPQQGAGGLP